MRIVHLSDAHFNYEMSSQFIHNILTPLKRDLLKFHNETPIDLICFTGDLLDKGGLKNPEHSYKMFKEVFIDEILDKMNLAPERFLMIPGNHDIERGRIHKFIEKQLQETLVDRQNIQSNMKQPELLNLERYKSYKKFQDNYYKSYGEYKSNDFGYSISLEIDGKRVAVAGLNSSWRSSDEDDKNRLIIGSEQLDIILNDFNGEEFDIKVALMHHPYDHLIECDKDDVEGIITREFDLLLTGHVHRSSSYSYQNNLGHGTIRSTASSNWDINVTSDSISHCNGYTIIDFNEISGKATLYNQRYSSNKLRYIPNIDISQNEDGTTIFELPTNKAREQWKFQSEIIDKIKSNYLPFLDEHLLIHNTDTKAPKELESLFVLPKIVVKQEKDNKEEEILDFNQIVTTKEHLFLLGDQESGKSTLLYRIWQHVAKSSLEHKRLPIYIDMRKLDNSSHFTNEVAKYLGVKKDKVDEILENYHILLLLDNVTFTRPQERILEQMIKKIQSLPNVIVVSTSENKADGEVPIEYLTKPFFRICKVARIKHFQSNQIRTLMKKWFNLKENEKLHDRFENIVQTFHSLNIPTTPMAVSMFLWILEKQEEYKPKNNAAMLQNFIEKLLNKHNKIEVRSDEFDFYNQNSLLTHIAKKMFDTGLLNYRLSSFDLKKFIKQHFEDVGWRPKNIGKKPYYDWVPDYFIASGVLIEEQVEEETYLKFRLNCFFQFFLMQNIDINEDFRKHVFHDDHYLEFMSEIDYYTALHRDKTKALKRVITLMNDSYKSIFKVDDISSMLEGKALDKNYIQESPMIDQFETDDEIDEFINVTKRTEEDDDKVNDKLLEDSNSLTQVRIENKEPQKNYHKMKIIENSWILAARVLKNSEESKESEYKRQAYSNVLENSLVFMGLYQSIVKRFLEDIEKDNGEKFKDIERDSIPKEFLEVLLRFLPSVHQITLFQNLGTSKLEDVFRAYFDAIEDREDISLIHKFTALFMYTDLHPRDEQRYLSKMIPNQAKNIVKDFVFSKLHQYSAKVEDGGTSIYPELMKQVLYMDQSKKYHPQRQVNSEGTKQEIKKRQLLENAKNKKSTNKKRSHVKSRQHTP